MHYFFEGVFLLLLHYFFLVNYHALKVTILIGMYWDKKYSWFPLILIQIVHARRMYIINEDSRKSNLMTSWVKKQKNIQRKQGCEQKGCAKCTAGKIVWRNRKKHFFHKVYLKKPVLSCVPVKKYFWSIRDEVDSSEILRTAICCAGCCARFPAIFLALSLYILCG